MDFESLSEVLKNPIRRKIVLFLYGKESVSYVDLMNAVEITNTGKFNYHLKVLGDLIEKDEDGKYGLSEKGLLAVQFLQKFDNASVEPVFETHAFSLFAGFMWLLLVYPFLGLLFGWYRYFTDPSVASRGDLAIPLITFSIIMVPAFVLFTINQFPKIEIDRDSITVKWATGRKFFIFEEAKIDVRGHILRLGGDLMAFGHFIPFKEKECMSLLSKKVQAYRSKPLYIEYVVPPLFLTILFALAPRLEGLFPPELWAILWGVTTALSMAMFAYSFPADMSLGNLRRGVSVVIYSVFFGVIIAISTLLSLL
jgi:hypothetical protein